MYLCLKMLFQNNMMMSPNSYALKYKDHIGSNQN